MIYNVSGPVVALIDAADEDEAKARLNTALIAAGFEPYDFPGTFDAFESDDQDTD